MLKLSAASATTGQPVSCRFKLDCTVRQAAGRLGERSLDAASCQAAKRARPAAFFMGRTLIPRAATFSTSAANAAEVQP
jgi:hypothetical protein